MIPVSCKKFKLFKLIYEALQSLSNVYKHKNSSSDDLRRSLLLNLSATPNLMLQPPFTDTVIINFANFSCLKNDDLKKKR